jgi:tRNA (guanine9-N1)-methyltransferase
VFEDTNEGKNSTKTANMMSESVDQVEQMQRVAIDQSEDRPVQSTEFSETTETPDQQGNQKPVIPEGMSKKQWKRLQKRKIYEERKSDMVNIRREKKQKARANRRAKIEELKSKGEPIPDELLKRRPQVPKDQQSSGVQLVIDCDFDDLMQEKERVSLSTQITRLYGANRIAQYTTEMRITSFNKGLKKRFEDHLMNSQWMHWDHVNFEEEPFVADDKCVYLSADAEEVLDTLEPGMTYVIGGIVDKGRYKNLCKDKAEKLGIKTKRLPIDEYIKLSGRRVLTTTHVVELMLKWFEFKDWKLSFETVLPQRKLVENFVYDSFINGPLEKSIMRDAQSVEAQESTPELEEEA